MQTKEEFENEQAMRAKGFHKRITKLGEGKYSWSWVKEYSPELPRWHPSMATKRPTVRPEAKNYRDVTESKGWDEDCF